MSAREKLSAIANVASIRRLQKLETQGQLKQAEDDLQSSIDREEKMEAAVKSFEDDLNSYLATEMLNVEYLTYHSAALLSANSELARASILKINAESVTHEKLEAHKLSSMRVVQADKLLVQTQRRHDRKFEEHRASEQEERTSIKWSQS
jgi:hypothetical protein